MVYGLELTERLAALTGSEPRELDFEAMNCQEATDELTRLEEMIAAFIAIDVAPLEALTAVMPDDADDIKAFFDHLAHQHSSRIEN